jgi:transposase
MPRQAPRSVLDPYELIDLRRLARAPSTPQALAFRARLILRCAHAPSPTNHAVAAALGCDPDTVSKWRRRFRTRRLGGLHDLPRSGRPAAFSPEDRHKVLVLATTPPADVGVPTSHWSLDELAFQVLKDAHYRDMSRSTIQRVLAEADLQPHRCRYWLKRHDPDFEAKALGIGGLYLKALALYAQGELVVSVDEKTSIQALARLHAPLTARPGPVERREFEYVRHGTRCLIGTWVVPTGQVLGSVTARRGTWDFVRHGRDVVEAFPHTKRFPWVRDNWNTQWTLELCRYLAFESGCWAKGQQRRRRTGKQRRAFLAAGCGRHVVHFTPKHGSWLNQIEIWFGVLSRRVVRRGDCTSVEDLTRKLLAYIAHYNSHFAQP